VLIGDAAHASSPMMGQGGSLAMEDAEGFNLPLQARNDALRAHGETMFRARCAPLADEP
jgi:2-polyprenyl-6-methoxyphenol hydroxylase-like FAD-dependent oxidoreductase